LEMIFPSLSLIADDEVDHKGSIYTIGVIGNQWYWNYELNLASGIIKYVSNLVLLEETNDAHKNLNRLLTTTKTLPIALGIKTSFYITSNDVAHSWSLPSLGLKVDAIPGRINLKTVVASRLGLYSGMCSELCGVEHGFMPISVQIMTLSDWWYNINDLIETVSYKKICTNIDIWSISDLNKDNSYGEEYLAKIKIFNIKNDIIKNENNLIPEVKILDNKILVKKMPAKKVPQYDSFLNRMLGIKEPTAVGKKKIKIINGVVINGIQVNEVIIPGVTKKK